MGIKNDERLFNDKIAPNNYGAGTVQWSFFYYLYLIYATRNDDWLTIKVMVKLIWH